MFISSNLFLVKLKCLKIQFQGDEVQTVGSTCRVTRPRTVILSNCKASERREKGYWRGRERKFLITKFLPPPQSGRNFGNPFPPSIPFPTLWTLLCASKTLLNLLAISSWIFNITINIPRSINNLKLKRVMYAPP